MEEYANKEIVDWDEISVNMNLNTDEYPVVIVKLRGRGYSLTDSATNLFYTASELKFEKVRLIFEGGKTYKVDRVEFANSRTPEKALFRKRMNMPFLVERPGRVKFTYKGKRRKIPIKYGAVVKVVKK